MRRGKSKFRAGDVVRLKSGVAAQTVVVVAGDEMLCFYRNDPDNRKYNNRYRSVNDFVHYEEKEECEMATLYETKNESPSRFGTLLAKNSQGKLVLEMKVSGEVLTFDPKDLEEVRPYTVKATTPSGPAHYEVAKGSLQVGDVVVTEAGIFLAVVEIDTKAKNPYKMRGRKVLTEALPD